MAEVERLKKLVTRHIGGSHDVEEFYQDDEEDAARAAGGE